MKLVSHYDCVIEFCFCISVLFRLEDPTFHTQLNLEYATCSGKSFDWVVSILPRAELTCSLTLTLFAGLHGRGPAICRPRTLHAPDDQLALYTARWQLHRSRYRPFNSQKRRKIHVFLIQKSIFYIYIRCIREDILSIIDTIKFNSTQFVLLPKCTQCS